MLPRARSRPVLARPALALALALLLAACRAAPGSLPGARPRSLLGAPLPELPLDLARRAALEADLRAAEERHRAAPDDEEAAIWHGRRLAYLGRYEEALAVYDAALLVHPRSHRLRRHRGHRYLTLRRLAEAEADLSRAAELCRGLPDEVEPDGAPNAAGVPRSTTSSNVFYHLGLARYLRGDFEGAADAWREGLAFARVNDDMLCATTYWLVLALRRAGRSAEVAELLAPIREDMEILENDAYHELLLLFRGERGEDAVLAGARSPLDLATRAYGVGAWRLLAGDEAGARELWRAVVADATTWPSFGHLAAEAELARAP